MAIIWSILIGYACGNFMTAYFLGKWVKGIDIRTQGTGNVGASNAVVVMGWPYGVITWACDILKSTLAVWLVQKLYGNYDYSLMAGFAAVLGHIYPLILKFKGGKGASSIFGIMLALNAKVALIMAGSLIAVTLITDYIALGTLVMYAIVWFYFYRENYGWLSIGLATIALGIVIWKHIPNIQRMIKREEIGFRRTRQINQERRKN